MKRSFFFAKLFRIYFLILFHTIVIRNEKIVQKHGSNCSTNTPRVFHVETTWKRLLPRRFNLESTWCVCRVAVLRIYDENQAIPEPIFLYCKSKCKQTKEQHSKHCLWTRIFTFLCDYCQLFFSIKIQTKQDQTVIIG